MPNMPPSDTKRRKKDRACDACRRRKTKCDGPWMLENLCTNCLQTRKPCTYVETSKPRGPPKAYVTGLEDRLEVLEALLEQIRPNADFSEELGPPVVRGSWKTDIDCSTGSSSKSATQKSPLASNVPPIPIPLEKHANDPAKDTHVISPSSRSTHLSFRPRPRPKRSRTDFDATLSSYDHYISEGDYSTEASSSSDTDEMVITSLGGRERITLRASEADDAQDDNTIRFHGRSSTAGLVEKTRQFKHMHMRETLSPTQLESTSPISPDNKTVAQTRRPEFWQTPHWELKYEGARADSNEVLEAFLRYFPPPNLAETLIDLYFHHSNIIFPLLHRPTFTRQWNQWLHHRNIWFACVCALIFAIASRWCEDERVLPTDEIKEVDWRSAGGQYFEIAVEIHRVRRNLLHPASLFEVQTFSVCEIFHVFAQRILMGRKLMGMYLRGSSAFPTAWIAISAGMRKAMDVGAHRKKVYRTEPSIDDELWKRAFWHLVVFDRVGGASLGRPCGITEEDFDLELPLEVDDDYWETGNNCTDPFKQPPGVPSLIAAFNQFIKLTQIMAFTMRTLYAIDKSKIFRGIVPIERDNIVKNLSVALADWVEGVPEQRISDLLPLHNGTLILDVTFYLTQMLVCRPLIPSTYPTSPAEPISPQDSSPIQPALDPAIVICIEAAKSCASMVDFQLRQGLPHYHPPNIINVSYICAGFFLLVGWNLKVQEKASRNRGTQDLKPPLAQRVEENIAQAKIFIRALEALKHRWEIVDSLLEELRESLRGLECENADLGTTPPSCKTDLGDPLSNSYHVSHDNHQGRSSLSPPTFPHEPTFTNTPFTELHTISDTEPIVQIMLPSALSATNNSKWAPLPPSRSQCRSSNLHPPPFIGRTRATSIAAASAGCDDQSLPYISSMRRTSFPNLSVSGRNTQIRVEDEGAYHKSVAVNPNHSLEFREEVTDEACLTTPRHLYQNYYQPSSSKYGVQASQDVYDRRNHQLVFQTDQD